VAIVHRRRRSGLGLGSDVCHREGVILSACWPFYLVG
jgi:hypothetical protein